MSQIFIAHDFCGFGERYGRFTYCDYATKTMETLVCKPHMDQREWDQAQLAFFEKYPGIPVHKCLEGAYTTDKPLMGSTDEICDRLRKRLHHGP